MKVNNIYVNMFYVLDAEYEEHPTEELALVLGGMNSFVFVDRKSVVPDYYDNFEKLFKQKFGSLDRDITLEDAYEFCIEYLKIFKYEQELKLFKKVSKEEWMDTLK